VGDGDKPAKLKVRDMVADGLYVAAAATRLDLKNRILVDTIARGEDFDVDHFVEDARDSLTSLAIEAEADAKRIEKQRKKAARRFSESFGTHDYRRGDVRNLKKREKQSLQVAAELRRRAEQPEVLRTLVEEARAAAWGEVSRNIDSSLRIEAARPDLEPDYAKLREARMQALRLVDLPRLSAHRKRAKDAAKQAAKQTAKAEKKAAKAEKKGETRAGSSEAGPDSR
jgi:hypothetical protein